MATRMTLRGEVLRPQPRYPLLMVWIDHGRRRVAQVEAVAHREGHDAEKQAALTVTLDRRPMSMAVILQAVRHNLSEEYPLLLNSPGEYNLGTVYALNHDDRYRLQSLADHEALQGTPTGQAIRELLAHLEAIPPQEEVEASAQPI